MPVRILVTSAVVLFIGRYIFSSLTLFILYVVDHLLHQHVVASSRVEAKQLIISPFCAEALFTSAAVLRQTQDVTPP